ncbi:hypothetical protein XENOCAPTIV_015760, partial [Xenoophorus captivus]
MRFKPPPPNSDIGWRVEFRPMEVFKMLQYVCLAFFWRILNNDLCCFTLQVQLTDFENAAYVVFVVLLTRVILSYKLDFLIPLSKNGVETEGGNEDYTLMSIDTIINGKASFVQSLSLKSKKLLLSRLR